MTLILTEANLPTELTAEQAVQAAYAPELAELSGLLRAGMSVRIWADRELHGPLAAALASALPSGSAALTRVLDLCAPGEHTTHTHGEEFVHERRLRGVRRERLPGLLTRSECHALGGSVHLGRLHRRVAGLSALQLRRVLAGLADPRAACDPTRAFARLRQLTCVAPVSLPSVDLDRDVGGCASAKAQLRTELLEPLARCESAASEAELAVLESLLPRGLLLTGPTGTGKSLLARAVAAAMGAGWLTLDAATLSGRSPAEGDAVIRRAFRQARQCAPTVLHIAGLDNWAEHAMGWAGVLSGELDDLADGVPVLVAATAAEPERVPRTLLRQGRLELTVALSAPSRAELPAIWGVHERQWDLTLAEPAREAVLRFAETARPEVDPPTGADLAGHARTLARYAARAGRLGQPLTAAEVETALAASLPPLPVWPANVERVVAVHEAGHALCAMLCAHARPMGQLRLDGHAGRSRGFQRLADSAERFTVTRGELLDELCVLMGGREAEQLLLDDVSVGSADDLRTATELARAVVEQFGLGGVGAGVQCFAGRLAELPETRRGELDQAAQELLDSARRRAARILSEHRAALEMLRDLLREHRTIDTRSLAAGIAPSPPVEDGLPVE